MKKTLFLLLAALFAMQGWAQQTIINESFEGSFPPAGWTNYATAFTQNSTLAHTGTHSIGYFTGSDALPTYGIITPQFAGSTGQLLSFYIYTGIFYGSDLYYTSFRIKVSTTDNSASSFSTVKEYSTYDYDGICANKVILTQANFQGTWYECTADLSEYNGQQIYVAIEVYDHFGCELNVQIDDILIVTPWANDLTAVNLSPYNMVTGQAQVPYFTLKNRGLTAVTSSDYTIQLTDGGSYTQTISGVDLAMGQDTTIAFPAYTAATLGAMTLTATITYAADLYAADNTITSMGQVYDLPVYDYNAYTLNTTDSTYYSFDVFTSALTAAGTGIPSTPFPMSETWIGDKIAKVCSDGSFGYVLANGTFAKIGDLISPVKVQPVSLAYDRTNSILYVLGIDTSNTAYLGTVDLASLEVAVVGNTNNAQLIIGIDFADDGYLYGPAIENNKLYKIDPSDATTTEIGNVGFDLNYGQDVAYDYVTHKLYSYAYVNSVGVKYGYYNLNTGAFIEIAPIAVAGQYACITIITNTLPPCYQVAGITSSEITTSTATIRWASPESIPANGYEYYLSTSAIAPTDDNMATGIASDTVVYLQDLMPNTPYYIWVRSNCGSERSLWSNFSAGFRTACVDVVSTFPFTEGFEETWLPAAGAGNQPAPPCWTVIDKGGTEGIYGASQYWWQKGTTPAHSGDGHAVCYTDFGTSSHNDWLITPQLALTGNEGLKFWAMCSNSTTDEVDEISIFISDEDITLDASGMGQDDTLQGFHRIFNQVLPVGNWQQYEINLSQYSGNRYIAFVRQGTPDGWNLRLDDVEIAELPVCMKPTSLAANNIQPTEATISWTNGSETDANWLLLYKPALATTYDTLAVTENPYLLQGLYMANTYNVMLITNCGIDSSETSSVLTFTTLCSEIAIPYVQNFDDNTNIPACWTTFGSLGVYAANATSQPNTLRFNGNTVNIAVLPVFEADVNTAKISFVLRKESITYSGTMDFGYLTDITDANSFVAVMTDILTVQNVNASFDIDLSVFPAGIKNIAFRQTPILGYWYWLDNIFVYDPNCLPVSAFATQNLAVTSADIIWTDESSPSTSWNVEIYSVPQLNPTIGGGNIHTEEVDDTIVNVTNLNPSTTYYVYVKNDCGWSNYNFTTLCMPVTTLPYTQNFDSYATGTANPLPICWTKNSTYLTGYPYITTSYSVSSPNTLVLYNSGTSYTAAFLPEFGMPLNNLAISFSALFGSSSVVIDIVAATDPLNSSTWTVVGSIPLAGLTYSHSNYFFSLGAYQGSETYIGFRNTSSGSFYIDNVIVSDCAPATNIHTGNLTATSADIIWSDLAQITGWTLKVSSTTLTNPTSQNGDMFEGPVTGTPIHNVSGLTAETTYYVYVQNNCDTTWVSFSFTTPATCPLPTGLTLVSMNAATSEATLSWNALGATGWNIKVSSTVLTNPENETADIENAGTATGTPQFLVTGLTMGSTYYYYIQSDCGSPWANHSFLFDYCTPAPSSDGVDGNGITNVSFGSALTVDNTTGAEAGDYGNYSSMIGTAVRGFDFTVAITYSTGWTYGTKIWIDTNQNLIFEANELLYTGLSASANPTTLIATIPIPASLPLGNYRMRIGGTDNDTGPNGPCNIGAYGCMEDYTVQVIEPFDDDLEVVAVTVYDMFVGNTPIPKVTIRNNGLNAAMDGTYSVMLTDGAAYSQTVTGVALNSAANTVLSFPALAYTTGGTYTFTATIIYSVDLYGENDTLSANITVYDVPIYPHNAYLTNNTGYSARNFHSFDVFTSANTLIGPAGSGPTPMSDVWVGTGNTGQGDGKIARILNDNSFGYVLENGAFIKTGNLLMPGTVSSAAARSLAYNRTTNVLYILLTGANNISYLGEVNLQTLEVTLIGNTNNNQLIIGIDLAHDGYLYGPALNDDKLYKIDPATAVTTEIGATGLDLNYAQDCAFDYVTNKLYSYAYDYTDDVGSIHYGYYNLTTGAFTEIAPCPDFHEVLTEVIIHNTLPSCMQVVNVQASNITTNTATVTWNTPDVVPAAGYEYYLSTSSTRPAESEPATGTASDTAVELSSLTSATTYYIWVRSLCSDTEVTIWNHYPGSFTTACPDGAITTFPWTEGFEAGLQCWSQESSSGSVTWTNPAYYSSLGTPPAEGTSIAYLYEAQISTRHWTKLISPVLDLTELAEPYLVYKHIQQLWYDDQDHLTVYYRTSATDTWTELQTFTSDIPAWQQDSIALPNPSATYQIAFDGGVAYGYGVGLDAITVSGTVSCVAPTALNSTTLTHNAATITWTAGDAETQWQVAWKEAAASAWSNPVGVATTTYNISGLTAATDYNVRVRAICSASNISEWSDAITFTTLTCLDPTNTTTTAITANSITITWQPMNGETDWKISWRNMSSGALGSGDAHNNDNEGYSIIDLVPNTEYQICVTAICAEDVESDPTNCINASTIGIHDLTLANSLQLYPNPTTGELKIKNYELQEGDKIEIYNVLGQKQQLTTNHYPLTTINVSRLSAGIYTVKIGGYVGKFVKK